MHDYKIFEECVDLSAISTKILSINDACVYKIIATDLFPYQKTFICTKQHVHKKFNLFPLKFLACFTSHGMY